MCKLKKKKKINLFEKIYIKLNFWEAKVVINESHIGTTDVIAL